MQTIMQLKAKPIFQEEKNFLEEKLNIYLPNDCWIVGGSTKYIYLDIYSSIYYIKFKVENDGKFVLTGDNRNKLQTYNAITIQTTIQCEKDRLNQVWDNMVNNTINFVTTHKNVLYSISISGGKDSEVLYKLWYDVLKKIDFTINYEFIFFNTTNEVFDVYKYIKSRPEIRIVNPDVSWYDFIKNSNYLLPTVFKRTCCTKYKEGQVKQIYDNKVPRVQVIGMRSHESTKRSKYQFYMDYEFDIKNFGTSNIPKTWSKLCPLIDLTTVDTWLLILLKDFYINPKYKKGWTRVGCNICPFSDNYSDELNKKYYPKLWDRFVKMATESYLCHNVLQVEGYSLDEYINGAWKRPVSKDEIYLRKKPTHENIHQYALYKGISDEMAKKYWVNTCSQCGKKVTPVANSMFFKHYGRFENKEDNRGRLCQKCLCKELGITSEEYFQIALDFKNEGCNLF